ncbi:MAG: hypothetical protein QXS48_04410 [Candidatus Aenigmatarchaeota archaeon]
MSKKLDSIVFIFILLLLATVIIVVVRAYYNLLLISSYTAFFVIVVPSTIAAYYCKKFLENFEKNEQYVATLIFIHPKVREWFKIMFVTTFIFGITWSLSLLREYQQDSIVNLIGGLGILFSTYLVLLSLSYFFKNLYEITKSD